MTSDSHLEKVLEKGEFAVTSECGPPRGADPTVITKKGELIKESVDAINITDRISEVVKESKVQEGSALVFYKHTTGAILVAFDAVYLVVSCV